MSDLNASYVAHIFYPFLPGSSGKDKNARASNRFVPLQIRWLYLCFGSCKQVMTMMKWYMKWIIYELRIWNQVKLWSSQLWAQFLQLRRDVWQIQDFNGVPFPGVPSLHISTAERCKIWFSFRLGWLPLAKNSAAVRQKISMNPSENKLSNISRRIIGPGWMNCACFSKTKCGNCALSKRHSKLSIFLWVFGETLLFTEVPHDVQLNSEIIEVITVSLDVLEFESHWTI